ncbi:MAG TPA: FecR domain-containing protein, partial [Myxococcaceae bacterium]|nr:FecR domain-containing protein [Myxococcaceae bacterium]
MSGRDLRAGLREAEELYAAQAPSSEAERRMRERLFGAPRRRFAMRVAMTAVAVVLIAAGAWLILRPTRWGDYEVAHASWSLKGGVDAAGAVEVTQGKCDLIDRVEGEQLHVDRSVRLRKEGGGVRVLLGAVSFEVAKRAKTAAPAQILVSGGEIAVLGTRFAVEQEVAAGKVTLFEGTIRFTATDGRQRTLDGTGELSWPLPPDAPPVAPPTPVPPLPPPPSRTPISYADADQLLQQVDTLRSRGEYEEAVRYLESGLQAELHASTRERFSYELGAILSVQLHDATRACPHWSRHLRQFRR